MKKCKVENCDNKTNNEEWCNECTKGIKKMIDKQNKKWEKEAAQKELEEDA